ncbi:cyclic-di-AMP-binding protein CbpB [Lactobacillus gasseri]|jgi:predicted transcriptional regulator|uniref:CBS domain protein n=2 Tax=Lactobacillus gasseri TaxID=1596 RepID=D1YFJ1_LACGS|nr:cyclic-di-AMP-binding protein CbpB [Lactobacillus gasseri]EFB63681.1 CBS domain protein [Lactobacillus gasseri 224-1]KFL97144.1 CBS domain containing protein [Lactobacillus gasseri SV-16A-US]MCZ3948153.1 CBS domain-containing protein [Lactobacillus gasseri]QTH67045.1 CBS domain-containing protein [Lactobacillus gasseri]RGL15268.1 CBS domain-containing protein [Lactobacillus gasseri]
MFSPSIQSLIEEKAGSFIIPASRIAFVEDENPLYHAFLILTKMKYSKIPVLDKNQKVVGLISLAMITDKMLTPDNIVIEPLSDLKAKDVMQTDFETINFAHTNLETQLHLLVDNPFVPVVNDNNIFQGLLTRREWIKAFNYVTHSIDDKYDITKKSKPSETN